MKTDPNSTVTYLTKREHFAILFAQAIVGNSAIAAAMTPIKKEMTMDEAIEFDGKIMPAATAITALNLADALIAQLNKTNV